VNFNLTLVIQMLVFATAIWVTMKFVWPMILTPMEERSRRIAQGLAAAEEGRKAFAEAEAKAQGLVREARERAAHILDAAQKQAHEIVEQARGQAGAEGARLLAAAQQQIELDAARAREDLRRDLGALAVRTAARVLEREVDAGTHAELIAKLATEI